MTEFVHLYCVVLTMNFPFICYNVNPILCHLCPFGDSTLSSPQREHDHSHSMFGSNIYRQWGYSPCTHPFSQIR